MDDTTLKTQLRIEEVIVHDGFELVGRGRYWRGREHDSLIVDIERQLYYWNSRGHQGDIFSWFKHVHGLLERADQRVAIAQWAGISLETSTTKVRSTKTTAPKAVIPLPTEHPPPALAWQSRLRHAIHAFHLTLMIPGSPALTWLRQRGLTPETLRHFQVGYNPRSGKYDGLWFYNGITIPHLTLGHAWGCKIRLGAEGKARYQENKQSQQAPKYINVPGGQVRLLFNAEALLRYKRVFICEGEFDAMLLWQEIGDLAGVVTLGAAGYKLPNNWIHHLQPVSRYYLVLDDDYAGQKGISYLLELLGRRARRVSLPAHDITVFHQQGGDLRAWANSVLV